MQSAVEWKARKKIYSHVCMCGSYWGVLRTCMRTECVFWKPKKKCLYCILFLLMNRDPSKEWATLRTAEETWVLPTLESLQTRFQFHKPLRCYLHRIFFWDIDEGHKSNELLELPSVGEIVLQNFSFRSAAGFDQVCICLPTASVQKQLCQYSHEKHTCQAQTIFSSARFYQSGYRLFHKLFREIQLNNPAEPECI